MANEQALADHLLSTPIYIQFTAAPTIRKWSHEPFEGAVRYDAAGALALDDDELADLISEAISDSLDVDWRPIDAARCVVTALRGFDAARGEA